MGTGPGSCVPTPGAAWVSTACWSDGRRELPRALKTRTQTAVGPGVRPLEMAIFLLSVHPLPDHSLPHRHYSQEPLVPCPS